MKTEPIPCIDDCQNEASRFFQYERQEGKMFVWGTCNQCCLNGLLPMEIRGAPMEPIEISREEFICRQVMDS